MSLEKKKGRISPEPIIPHAIQQQMAANLAVEYEVAANKGEFLVKAFFDIAVISADYIDNARLWLLRGSKGEPLELDRYFRERVAIEFNGTQHLGATAMFDDPDAAASLQSRDTRKLWLCAMADIELVRIFVADLHPLLMARMIPDRLRQRRIDETGPYYLKLCSISESYIEKATGVNIKEVQKLHLAPLPARNLP